jgi:hypothetical protein
MKQTVPIYSRYKRHFERLEVSFGQFPCFWIRILESKIKAGPDPKHWEEGYNPRMHKGLSNKHVLKK